MIIHAFSFSPLVRVQEPSINTYAIREVVDSFMREHAQLGLHEGGLTPQLVFVDTSDELLDRLASLLNEALGSPWNFTKIEGTFAHPVHDDHQWLADRGVIVDIGIQVFKDSPILSEEIKNFIAPYGYYVSDTPSDPLYKLYSEVEDDDV